MSVPNLREKSFVDFFWVRALKIFKTEQRLKETTYLSWNEMMR
jgi:hypothetical protein